MQLPINLGHQDKFTELKKYPNHSQGKQKLKLDTPESDFNVVDVQFAFELIQWLNIVLMND